MSQEGTAMPNAVVMTGYGPPDVLKWARVPLPEPGAGQIRIKVKAAGVSPTDLALRAGYLKAVPLPPDAVLGFEAAGTVDAVGPGVTGTAAGDGVTALLFSLGGYAEYAVASIWTGKPETVSWADAAALPSSAEAAAGLLRQLGVASGETLLLFGGGGSVGIIATQLAVARGVRVISAVGERDEPLARELGATPVRYGAGLAGRVRMLGAVDAVFDAAGQGVLADAVALAGRPQRVITLSDPAAADFGVTLSEPTPDRAPGALDETIALLAGGRLRLRAHKTMAMQQAAEAHRQLESGSVHERIILTLEQRGWPSGSARVTARPARTAPLPARAGQVVPRGQHQPRGHAGDQRGRGRVRARGGHRGHARGHRGQDPQRQSPRPSLPDPGQQARSPLTLRGHHIHYAPAPPTPAPPRMGSAEVGHCFAAPEPGAQRRVGRGRVGELPRVAAVVAVGMGGAGGSAPGGVHLVVGQIGARLQTQGSERVSHEAGSVPKASSSTAVTSGSRVSAGPGVAARSGPAGAGTRSGRAGGVRRSGSAPAATGSAAGPATSRFTWT
jgi:NADPH:quinone reductase-like Zn-dependent oxidoreductase